MLMAAFELLIAAQNGDCDKLRELLDSGGGASDSVVDERAVEVMVEGTRETGEKVKTTALYEAVANEQHAAVELLLEHKANPNLPTSLGNTPLMEAAARGHLLILRTLLDRKDIVIDAVNTDSGCTAFHWACGNGNADCAVELARRGCDMTLRTKDGETGKDIAEHLKHTAVLEELRALVVEQLRATQSSDAVHDKQGDVSSLAPLVTARKLCIAAQNGDCDKLRELLDGTGGAPLPSVVNERTEHEWTELTEMETGEKVKTTALIQAVAYEQYAAVELLLEHKANPNLPNLHSANPNLSSSLGVTPLMAAAKFGHLHILQTLLGQKAIAVDAVSSKHGLAAFHYACDYGQADCAVELIRHGCNSKLRDKSGDTGWDRAELRGHEVLIRRCKLAQKLTLRKTQQQDKTESSAPVADGNADTGPQAYDPDEQAKVAKKAAANRKKKDRKKAKKAAQQQRLLYHAEAAAVAVAAAAAAAAVVAEAEPEPEPDEPEPALAQPELQLDERMQQRLALTELGVQQWSAAQVLEWVALADLSPQSVCVVSRAFESLDLDGEELQAVIPKTLQKLLAKHGALDAEALARQVIEQRDALLLPGDSTAVACPDSKQPATRHECPICMELFCDDTSGQRVPRLLSSCGHTVCHGCITDMLALVSTAGKKNNKKKNGGSKACKCPTCSKVTQVEGGDASSLHRNWLAM
eukprot:COSAG06_NODE_2308_length_7109_cov_7.230385_4_plen_697_part_00